MIHYRSLSFDDLASIVAIENQSFQEPWSRDGFSQIMSNPSFTSMGLFMDGKLAGYVFYYLVLDELHVMNVAVDPIFRNQKLATKLLTKVHDFGKEKNIKYAYLEVRETNEAAQKLYACLGYQKQGRRIGYYSNQEDALLMYKEL